MKILLAVDGSDYTKRMLSYLSAHQELLGSAHEHTVLHTVLPVPYRAAAFIGPGKLDAYYDDEARAVLDPIRALMRDRGIDAAFVHKVGDPADEIATFAEAGGFELLAMGSHGHGALGSLVLGSVATRVLARSAVPVLLVR